MKTLDRHVLSLAIGRWLTVLTIGTGLMILGDFIANLGDFARVLGSSQWWLFFVYIACRLPEFLQTWLPMSTLAAAMLTALPMLRQGTLVALGAAGIAPARVFRMFTIVAFATGLAGYVLGDQVVPRLVPVVERVQAAMAGKAKLNQERARPVGWRSGPVLWSAGFSLPSAGVYNAIVGFRDDRTSKRMLMADALEWKDGSWYLVNIDLSEGDRLTHLDRATPSQVGLSLDQEPEALSEALRPDNARTSDELWRSGSPRFTQITAGRIGAALLPLLCLWFALPRFIRWADRSRLAAATVQTLLWAALPLAGVGILTRVLITAGAHPLPLALGALGFLLSLAWLRFRRMRL